jgi:prepilin-type N-terminal cleavage/methylation domain-containing protein
LIQVATMPASRNRIAPRRGFTLAEVLIAASILALAAAALAQALSAGHQTVHDALHQARAQALGEALLDEVISLPYDDPQGAAAIGPDAGEASRAAFDNIDDFHGYSEAAGSLADAQAAAYPAVYQDFARSVTVSASTQTVAGYAAPVEGLAIVVTVTDATGRSWPISRFVRKPS